MIYRIRHVRLDDNGRVCWEDHRRTEYRSARRNLLGQIITRKTEVAKSGFIGSKPPSSKKGRSYDERSHEDQSPR